MELLIKKTLAMLLAAGSLMCFAAGCGDKDSSSTVSKKKIQKAEAAASLLSKAGSAAMVDLENRNNEDLRGVYWLTGKNIGAKGETLPYGDEMKIENPDVFPKYVKEYFSDIAELEEAGIYFMDGTAVGGYVKTADGYFGAYPYGLITKENYDFDMTVEDCVKLVEEELEDTVNGAVK